MATVMMLFGAGMLLGSVWSFYGFFTKHEKNIPVGVSTFEAADFPRMAGLLEAMMFFSFGLLIFVFGLTWMLFSNGG